MAKIGFKDIEVRYQNAECRGYYKLDNEDNKMVKALKRKLNGQSLSEVNEDFWEIILEAINTAKEWATVESKNKFTQDICNYYFEATGLTIPNNMLVALADFILDDTLTDKNVDKVTETEYAILSHRQISRRNKREWASDDNSLEYSHHNKTDGIAKKNNYKEMER